MPRPLLFIAIATISVFPLVVVARSSPPQPDATAPIRAIHEQWAKDWKNKDIADLRALYAENSVLLPAEHTIVEGPDRIGDQLQKLIDESPNNGSFFFVADSVEVSGDLAYDSGFIQYWPTGRIAPVKGFYILILKRNANGNWLISRHALTQISPTNMPARN